MCNTKLLRHNTSDYSHGIRPLDVSKLTTGVKPVTELARLRKIELEVNRARVKAAREQAQASKTVAKQVREAWVKEKVSAVKAIKASYGVKTLKTLKVTQPQRIVGTCIKKKRVLVKDETCRVTPQVDAVAEFEAIVGQEDSMTDALEARVKALFLKMGLEEEEDLDEVSMDEEESDDDLEAEIEERLNAMALFRMDNDNPNEVSLDEIDVTPCCLKETTEASPSEDASPVNIPAPVISQAAILTPNPITTITPTQVDIISNIILETITPSKSLLAPIMSIPMAKVTEPTYSPYILALLRRLRPRVKLKSPRLSWKRVRLKSG